MNATKIATQLSQLGHPTLARSLIEAAEDPKVTKARSQLAKDVKKFIKVFTSGGRSDVDIGLASALIEADVDLTKLKQALTEVGY